MTTETSVSPVNQALAAAADKDLKLLIRQQDTAARRVAKALDDQADLREQLADYLATHYPALASGATATPVEVEA